MKELLRIGVDADLLRIGYDRYPIHTAAYNNNSKAIDLLLKNGARVNSVTCSRGSSALHICVRENFTECVDVLLNDKDLDVDIEDYKGGQTPLYIAASRKNVGLAKTLIEHGASLNHTIFRKTVLEHIHQKIPHFNPSLVKVIVPRKVFSDREIKFRSLSNLVGNAAMLEKNDSKKYEMYLEEFKSILLTLNKDQGDIFGYANASLLRETFVESLPDFAEALLIEGFAKPNEMDYAKTPPLLTAARSGNLKSIKLLLRHGAKIEAAVRRGFYENILHVLHRTNCL